MMLWNLFSKITMALLPLADLIMRLYVAHVFLNSGLSKVADWSATLDLFQNEYHVPLLNPVVAAYVAATGELGLSILLALGLGTRFAAAGLFILNITAVVSYYSTLVAVPGALTDHLQWGIMLFLLVTSGGSPLRSEYWLWRWLSKKQLV
ncbi:MAG: DoxX family protein [Pseudomonadales bacterium]|nr:DoxX family protein [Pseudomonadales bacterium]